MFHRLNILGWLVLSILNTFSQMQVTGIFWLSFVPSVWLGIAGCFVTAALRQRIHKGNIYRLTGIRLISHLIFYAIICSILIMLPILIFMDYMNPQKISQLQSSTAFYLGNLVNIAFIILMWQCLYFGLRSFNKLRKAANEKRVLESALKEAKLNTLIGQLNPHFMFNTLNNIRAMVLVNGEKSRDMIAQLSDILRYSLTSDQSSYQKLSVELQVVDDFIALAKMQYEEKLLFDKNIESAALSCLIPSMSVQILVENAVKHGISQCLKGGRLSLKASIINDYLEITIINPKVKSLPSEEDNSTGIGLRNIQARLNLLYKEQAQLSIEHKENEFIVKLRLPIIENESVLSDNDDSIKTFV